MHAWSQVVRARESGGLRAAARREAAERQCRGSPFAARPTAITARTPPHCSGCVESQNLPPGPWGYGWGYLSYVLIRLAVLSSTSAETSTPTSGQTQYSRQCCRLSGQHLALTRTAPNATGPLCRRRTPATSDETPICCKRHSCAGAILCTPRLFRCGLGGAVRQTPAPSGAMRGSEARDLCRQPHVQRREVGGHVGTCSHRSGASAIGQPVHGARR